MYNWRVGNWRYWDLRNYDGIHIEFEFIDVSPHSFLPHPRGSEWCFRPKVHKTWCLAIFRLPKRYRPRQSCPKYPNLLNVLSIEWGESETLWPACIVEEVHVDTSNMRSRSVVCNAQTVDVLGYHTEPYKFIYVCQCQTNCITIEDNLSKISLWIARRKWGAFKLRGASVAIRDVSFRTLAFMSPGWDLRNVEVRK
jgi:hypothetical protein